MKKFISAFCMGIASIATPSDGVCAQSSDNHIAFDSTKNFLPSVRKLAAYGNGSYMGEFIPATKSINARAFDDFRIRFKNVDNAMWFVDSKGGFTSYFVQGGYGSRVLYDKKGRWLYSLINYGEDKLPREVRAAVKSVYYDMTISVVEEIRSNENTQYIISLEDKSNIKVIRVNEQGEMKILQELTK